MAPLTPQLKVMIYFNLRHTYNHVYFKDLYWLCMHTNHEAVNKFSTFNDLTYEGVVLAWLDLYHKLHDTILYKKQANSPCMH